jgi:hypothetical protein
MVTVDISWNIPPKYATIAKTRFGEVIGITLYSPSIRKPDVKYPYIAYSYKRTPCAEWVRSICAHHVGDIPEGTYMYISGSSGEVIWGVAVVQAAIGRVKEGASYEQPATPRAVGWKALNIEKVVDNIDVEKQAPQLLVEASKRGWMISRSTRDENLLAVWAVVNKIVSEEPVTPKAYESSAEPTITPLIYRIKPELF